MSEPRDRVPEIRRILVALDASPHSLAALASAATLAQDLDAELVGLFVEDADVLRTADLPFTQEVRTYTVTRSGLSSMTVRRQYRAQANRARQAFDQVAGRARVRHHFAVVRGRVADELLAAADEADLITLGKAGTARSSRRKLGTTARSVLERAPGPVLVAHRDVQPGRAIVAVYEGSSGGDHALEVAVRLARRRAALPFKVLVTGSDADAAQALQQRVTARFGDAVPRLHFRPLTRLETSRLAEVVAREASGLVVAAADSPLLRGDRLQQFLYEVDSPVLLVRP